MKTVSTRKRLLVVSLVAAWAAVTFACTVEDENPGNPTRTKTETKPDGSTNPATEDPKPVGDPICGKYGGAAGAQNIAKAIINRAAGDCRIGQGITMDPGNRAHFEECFVIMIQGGFQCPGISYVSGQTKDSKGENCRSMQQAHQGMQLRLADYNAFLEAVAAEFTAAGISLQDQTNVAPIFEGQKNNIIQSQNQPDRNRYCTCPNNLYNGQPCNVVVPIIDAGQDVKDTGVQDTGIQDANDGG